MAGDCAFGRRWPRIDWRRGSGDAILVISHSFDAISAGAGCLCAAAYRDDDANSSVSCSWTMLNDAMQFVAFEILSEFLLRHSLANQRGVEEWSSEALTIGRLMERKRRENRQYFELSMSEIEYFIPLYSSTPSFGSNEMMNCVQLKEEAKNMLNRYNLIILLSL